MSWHNESYRHTLSAKGIKTSFSGQRTKMVDKIYMDYLMKKAAQRKQPAPYIMTTDQFNKAYSTVAKAQRQLDDKEAQELAIYHKTMPLPIPYIHVPQEELARAAYLRHLMKKLLGKEYYKYSDPEEGYIEMFGDKTPQLQLTAEEEMALIEDARESEQLAIENKEKEQNRIEYLPDLSGEDYQDSMDRRKKMEEAFQRR